MVGKNARTLQNPSRRRLLRHVTAGALGCNVADLMAREAQAAATGTSRTRARNVLVVYEEGGISQMDSWDPKPDQLADHRTPYLPIATSVPGIHFSSLMPRLARCADQLAVVRSMTTAKVAGHKEGCQEFFKGYRFNLAPAFPDIGSVVTEVLGTDCRALPGYIFAPGANMPNHITTTGFLSHARSPWRMGTKSLGENLADPNWKIRGLAPQPEVDFQRLGNRRGLLHELNAARAAHGISAEAMSHYHELAFDLLTSPSVHAALDFAAEGDSVRDRYGRDHRGCCYLLGRKLIEAGVRFVTVTVIQPPELVGRPNYGQPGGVFLNWDHHEGIYRNGPCGGPQGNSNQERYGLPHPVMMPSFDRSASALIEDMHERGLLDETLVCFISEMGRTPRLNKWQGRDHWGRAMSIAFAGAGVPGGQVIGKTDRAGGDVVDNLYTPYDYAETIYHKLGINTTARLLQPDGRPIDFSDGGRPIKELF